MRGLNRVTTLRDFDKLLMRLKIEKCLDSPLPEIDLKEHR